MPFLLYLVDDLKVPSASEENDTVDTEDFWTNVLLSIIARGLLKGTFNSITLTIVFYNMQIPS